MNQTKIKFNHKCGLNKILVGLLVIFLSFEVPAQEEALEENASGLPSALSGELPGADHLVAALSHEATRTDALLTMVVVAHLLQDPVTPGSPEARWDDERAWLDRLAARFPTLPLRSSALDAASWFIQLELDEHRIAPSSLVSPKGMETAVLIRQLFDRGDERLAAALLPEVLMRMESHSIRVWQELLSRAEGENEWLVLVFRIDKGWSDSPWPATEASSAAAEESSDPIGQALNDFQAMAASAVNAGAPDPLRLQQLRSSLFVALPELDEFMAGEAAKLLRLASAVDGLHEGKYLSFAETLLWVIMELLLVDDPLPVPGPAPDSVVDADPDSDSFPETDTKARAQDAAENITAASQLPRVLAELLPQLSMAFARDFSDTDPRINAILAAAFDIVQNLQSGVPDAARKAYLNRELADAFVQLVLMIPDMDFYFDQPVRNQITGEVDICTGIVAAAGQADAAALSREQFDRCLASLSRLSESVIDRAELAGDPDGPFGADQLRRELQLTPWQRINYTLGYLHERYSTTCELPQEPLPNPLEWAVLATVLAWFAEQSPVYFQTPANEALVVRMRQQGMNLLQNMEQQTACFSRSGKALNDPVRRSLFNYRRALEELTAGIREAELVFRQERLAPGADIVLSEDSNQDTAYRSEGLMIGPCQAHLTCEMTDEIESTRALIGLFPKHYLVADQGGLGRIEICYDNMKWVERHSEPTRPDDPNVADYYGHLSFDLIGRYIEDNRVSNVFGSNFISPDEYHYLFAAASDEVLDDSCPIEWVGSRIVVDLDSENSFTVVPDRLTYLASARNQPSQVIASNWSQGAEWRDWFVTGLGVTPFTFPKDEKIFTRIDQHLKTLYQAEQSMLYGALLRRPTRNGPDASVSLLGQMAAVGIAKTLVRIHMGLFYPDMLMDSDEIRRFLEGTGALIDRRVLGRFRESNVPVESINNIGLKRLAEVQTEWIHQLKTVRRSGSVALSVAHAITRLNALYQAFFALPPSPDQEVELIQSPL